jgi:hypothetical protein
VLREGHRLSFPNWHFSDRLLATVIDTSISTAGRKRPDVLAYVSNEDADLVLPAEIVIESKKPAELQGFADLREAMLGSPIWEEKTVPYIRDNITRIHYFILTTFTNFAALSVTPALRDHFVKLSQGTADESTLKALVGENLRQFQLAPSLPQSDPRSASAWNALVETHLAPATLAPVPISNIYNSLVVRTRDDFETFATRLADLAAGSNDGELTNAGLFQSIQARVPKSYDTLDAVTRRDLHIFLMTQHPGLNSSEVTKLAKEKRTEVVTEFIAASIHSLVGRFFAFKAIEDNFCVHEPEPLIDKQHWIVCSTRYDGKGPEEIRKEAFAALRNLKTCKPVAIQRFAVYGFFFDWIEAYIDPVLFRSTLEMFVSHDFDEVEGDLLGRFFEIYAQKINRTRRKALGQYYTPTAVVEFIWHLSLGLVRERDATRELNVLDPGMGSATFLIPGLCTRRAFRTPAALS